MASVGLKGHVWFRHGQLFAEQKEDVTGFNSDDLDLTEDINVLDEAISGFDVVINAAAYTNVNLAEKEPEKAFNEYFQIAFSLESL